MVQSTAKAGACEDRVWHAGNKDMASENSTWGPRGADGSRCLARAAGAGARRRSWARAPLLDWRCASRRADGGELKGGRSKSRLTQSAKTTNATAMVRMLPASRAWLAGTLRAQSKALGGSSRVARHPLVAHRGRPSARLSVTGAGAARERPRGLARAPWGAALRADGAHASGPHERATNHAASAQLGLLSPRAQGLPRNEALAEACTHGSKQRVRGHVAPGRGCAALRRGSRRGSFPPDR